MKTIESKIDFLVQFKIDNVLEPVKLSGDGEYNLNVLKQIKVTDSYLSLEQSVRGCQNEEGLHNCTTRHYLFSLLEHCRCLPFHLMQKDKQVILIISMP